MSNPKNNSILKECSLITSFKPFIEFIRLKYNFFITEKTYILYDETSIQIVKH